MLSGWWSAAVLCLGERQCVVSAVSLEASCVVREIERELSTVVVTCALGVVYVYICVAVCLVWPCRPCGQVDRCLMLIPPFTSVCTYLMLNKVTKLWCTVLAAP